MVSMLIRMTLITALYVILSVSLWLYYKNREIKTGDRIFVGLVFGVASILSTHFGVDYGNMLLNIRDMGPLAAGLFFDPYSGLMAGLIGGIERYIVGTYFGISSYTRIACSISTCLAGIMSMILSKRVFKGNIPSPIHCFFMGAVVEVFHMYVVFTTHQSDMLMAFTVVRTCAVPMIIFTGVGLSLSALLIIRLKGEVDNYFEVLPPERTPVALSIQRRLAGVILFVTVVSYLFTLVLQVQTDLQRAKSELSEGAQRIAGSVIIVGSKGVTASSSDEMIGYKRDISAISIGDTGSFDIIDQSGNIVSGIHKGLTLSKKDRDSLAIFIGDEDDYIDIFGGSFVARVDNLDHGYTLLSMIPIQDAFINSQIWGYETALANILLFTVVFVLITILVYNTVVVEIMSINNSLAAITDGDLDQVVDVRSSLEFDSLSNDINNTVKTLKGYIEAAKKKNEEELVFAYTIQDSALPKNFVFPGHDEFDIFASMNPAREVGGDFYDFFFAESNKLALVIADVSGKGIPAALFMMRAMSTVKGLASSGKSPEQIICETNNELCKGNDACMFVTLWVGILDLTTGEMECANAGHEYPVLCHEGGAFEYLNDKHTMPLGTIEDIPASPYSIKLSPGDTIFVYTDGVPEAINTCDKQYGTDRLLECLNENRGASMSDLLESVKLDVAEFSSGTDQFDDITMLGFHFKALT